MLLPAHIIAGAAHVNVAASKWARSRLGETGDETGQADAD